MRKQPTGRNVEVEVVTGDFFREVQFYIIERRADEHFLLQSEEGEGWIWVELEPGEMMSEPTLALHPDVAELLMEGIAEEVMGVEDPRDRQSRAEGKLEATENHLKDLRGLIGLDKESSKRTMEVEVGK